MTPPWLLDVTRRALAHALANTTDLAVSTMQRDVSVYSDACRHGEELALVEATPQLAGYSSELGTPGAFTTKRILGRPVLLTRGDDGVVHAFLNICRHRQAPVASGCGQATRFTCPYHAWVYDAGGRLLGRPGRDGFPEPGEDLVALPAAEAAGFLWVGLHPESPFDPSGHLGPLAEELTRWGFADWQPLGERELSGALDWKLAIDTFSENYHFATVHRTTFATIARSNCTVFDAFGPHHRLVFPLRSITALADQPEEAWRPLDHLVVIYALWPNIVLSVTALNGEIFRVYPGDRPGESVTFHQNASSVDLTDPTVRASMEQVFDYAHATVRDEDYALAESLQRGMACGGVPTMVFGRNEPGLQHRHATLDAALRDRAGQGRNR